MSELVIKYAHFFCGIGGGSMGFNRAKWKLAPWIISHFPVHKIYVEPFGGAGSVLLQKNRVPTEVWNDLDMELVNLFEVLREPHSATSLIQAVNLTPFARAELDLSYEASYRPVERARRFIVRSFFGFGSKARLSPTKNGFRCLRTGDASPAVDWSRYPDALQAIVDRMRGVVIENRPALDLIERFDREETLFYCDPPYLHGLRNMEQGAYRHEMSDDDHEALARSLNQIKGMAVVSGYPSDFYKELYKGWLCVRKRAYADKSSPRVECIWISPRASVFMPSKYLLEII